MMLKTMLMMVGWIIIAGGAAQPGQAPTAKPAAPAKQLGAKPPSANQPEAKEPVSQPDAPKPNPATIPSERKDAGAVQLHESFNARAKQGVEKGDIGVIFLGDSITQGWSSEGRQAWEERLAKYRPVNFGIGGDRTQHVLWRLDHGNIDGLGAPKSGPAPKLVVLMIGTNNSGDDSAEQIAQGVAAVVSTLRQKLPATKVLLLGIFPRSEKPDALRSKIMETNRLMSKCADGRNVIYFDFGNRFLEIDGTISKQIMPDALHLSPDGYRIWAEAVEPKLAELAGG